MSVLSTTAQKQVEDTLVSDGLLTADQLTDMKTKATAQSTPFLSMLLTSGKVSDESLTHIIDRKSVV